MITKAQVFEELVRVVLHKECTLEPIEGTDEDDIQGEGTTEPGTVDNDMDRRCSSRGQ
jgi:hypothetical protein